MKRIAIIAVMLAAMMTANATSVLYFTRSQAERAVSYLNRQNELMIYCGYDYEIETYVLLNEVWAERVNSAYYELWIYGYDAYTGEEIYMPIDLQCIWLYSAGRMYNAAQYLRFRTDGRLRMPTVVWSVPTYNHFTRVVHRPNYTRTYHYDVHRYGWMPPAPPAPNHNGPATQPYHPYYMRAPHDPAPRPAHTWTPGVDRPEIEHPAPARSSSGTRPTPTGINSNNGQNTSAGTPATPHSGTATSTPTRSSGTSAAPTRSTSTQNNGNKTSAPTRSSNTSTAPTRSSSSTSSTPSRSNSSTNAAPSRSTSTKSSDSKNTAPTRSSNTSTAPTRSSSTPSAAPSRSSSSTSAAPSRSTSTQSNDSKNTAPSRSGAPTRR